MKWEEEKWLMLQLAEALDRLAAEERLIEVLKSCYDGPTQGEHPCDMAARLLKAYHVAGEMNTKADGET
jgi:hypothetical protein